MNSLETNAPHIIGVGLSDGSGDRPIHFVCFGILLLCLLFDGFTGFSLGIISFNRILCVFLQFVTRQVKH
jgi:hypothetical protein